MKNTMKKVLCALLVVVMLVTSMPLTFGKAANYEFNVTLDVSEYRERWYTRILGTIMCPFDGSFADIVVTCVDSAGNTQKKLVDVIKSDMPDSYTLTFAMSSTPKKILMDFYYFLETDVLGNNIYVAGGFGPISLSAVSSDGTSLGGKYFSSSNAKTTGNNLYNVPYDFGSLGGIAIGSGTTTLYSAQYVYELPAIDWGLYNLGEETYSFPNYVDDDSEGGHCFGMSITSAGYYLGVLRKKFGVNTDKNLYEFLPTGAVKVPICYYQGIQGSIRDQSMVAGGTNYRNEDEYNIESDWNEVVNFVRNHEYDHIGNLQIGYRKRGEGGHSINFLRYEVVNGQERIYAYDNNYPKQETYFFQDENGEVRQAVYSTFSGSIDCITLRSVTTYFLLVSAEENIESYRRLAIYSNDSISVEGATKILMDGEYSTGEYYVYEIPENMLDVKITPLVDNASFTYMGEKYSFGEIDEDTYAEFTLSETESDTPEFEIINEPHEHTYEKTEIAPTCTANGIITYTCACNDSYTETIEATGHSYTDNGVCKNCDNYDKAYDKNGKTNNCSCNCHKGGFMGFIWKLINFFNKLFGMNKTCSCGVSHY